MKRMKLTSAGFTLMEVLVALTIFSITSLAATQLIVASTALISENNTASQAIAAAQGAIENMRNVTYAEMVDGSDPDPPPPFTITWTVSDDDPAPNMKTVVVKVSWQAKGETKYYEVESVYSEIT